MPFGPEIAYPVDFISFMFTKCQNRKPFNYNKLSGFRESLQGNRNHLDIWDNELDPEQNGGHDPFTIDGVLCCPRPRPSAGAAGHGWRIFHVCPHDHLVRDALQCTTASTAGDHCGGGWHRGIRLCRTHATVLNAKDSLQEAVQIIGSA